MVPAYYAIRVEYRRQHHVDLQRLSLQQLRIREWFWSGTGYPRGNHEVVEKSHAKSFR